MTEGKLDRGFREIKETAPLQTEGAVVECSVTSPADITLVYLYYAKEIREKEAEK